VLLAGIGPVLSWRRASWRRVRRTLAVPVAATLLALVLLVALSPAEDSWSSLAMFCLVTFVLVAVGQEFWRGASARRAINGEPWPRALGRLVGRNRRRYGGYLVHAGIAVLFLGVAASSAFPTQRDVRLSPGEKFRVDDYELTYRNATARLGANRDGTGAPIALGAVIDVRNGDKRFTMRPTRNFYPTQDTSKGTIGRYFEGEATSEVDLRWGLRRDFWLAIRPDISVLEDPIREANRKFKGASTDIQAVVLAALTERYRKAPPPAAFRAIASPLVVWIWIGGGIAVLGALVAAWPSPEARLRQVTSAYAARLHRELSRA